MTSHATGAATGHAADRLADAGAATGTGTGTGACGAGEGAGAGGVHNLAGGRVVAWLRALLLVGWAAIAITALSVGLFPTSLPDLKAAVATGQVHEVSSVGAMGAEVTGYGTQEVTWRQGGLMRRTEVRVLSPGYAAPASDLPSVGRDVTPQLRQLNPALVVHEGEPVTSSSAIYGVQMPPWVGLTWLVLALSTLALVVAGPEPWRASRWGWFWLGWLPGGQVAFLVLSGPSPLPLSSGRAGGWAARLAGWRRLTWPGPRAWRLSGGWAFGVMLVITALT